jgi:competence protein ComEC
MLPSLTLAFTSGLAIGSLVPYFPLSVSFFLFVTAIGAAILETRHGMTRGQATAGFGCVLTGIIYWAAAVQGTSNVSFFEHERELLRPLSGRIIAPVQQGPDRSVMVVRLDRVSTGSDMPRVVQLTWRTPERLVFLGDRIRVQAKLRAPGGSLNPGGFDYGAYIERQGIDATATVTGSGAVEVVESGRENLRWILWNQFDRWRGAIRLAAIRSLSQPALGLYLGVIIGERGYLDQELRDQFMVTGTVHLLSISGSHLGLVAILTFVAVRRTILLLPSAWLLALSRKMTPTRMAALATVLPVTTYACLAGAELATVRSLAMILVAMITKWLGYEQRMFHALAVAAIGILLYDPQAIYDISFQLSFLSVCAIAWWLARPVASREQEQPPMRSVFSKVMLWGRDAMVMSAVVTLVTIPLVAFYFNQLPWLGLFTNVVAVPVMGALLVPVGLVAALWHSAVGVEGLPLAGTLQWSIDRFVEGLNYAASVPGGEWHLASPSLITMLMFYVCLATVWLRSGRGRWRWMVSAGLLLLLSWWIWSPRLLPDGNRFRVTFLDVSQGDSAVLELPDGQVVLIDGGATYERFDMGRGVVAPYLWNRGITTIDHVIATHPQLDHVGGLAWVVRHFTVRNFWGTGDRREESFYRRLQQALAHQGLREQVARAGEDLLASESCRLRVLNPPEATGAQELPLGRRTEGRVLNNRSIVTELICGSHRILFTADVEQEVLLRMTQSLQQGRVDVVKVPHHGAASSLQQDWLKSLQPSYAVISVGRNNPYGHPAPSVLDAYTSQGVSIYRTDRDGGVWVTGMRSGSVLQINRTRDEKVLPVPLFTCFWTCEKTNWGKLIARWQA